MYRKWEYAKIETSNAWILCGISKSPIREFQKGGNAEFMITVKYEIVVNDHMRKFSCLYFPTLDKVGAWIIDKMIAPPAEFMVLPKRRENEEGFGWVMPVSFRPEQGEPEYRIHAIQNSNGWIFSDGEFTGGKKFCAVAVEKWLDEMRNFQSGNFQFVENEEDEI